MPVSCRGSGVGLVLLFVLLLISTTSAAACGGATFAYTINDQPVLLYKIIQWWYDAPASEAPWACGRTLSCRTVAPIEIIHTPNDWRLSLRFEAGFVDLVSAGTHSNDLRATWLDPNYFDAVTARVCPDRANTLGRLLVEGVAPDQADRLAAIANYLEVVISGPVCGLVDGRIAFTHSEALIKSCPASASPASASQHVTLTLRNRQADAVLAIFAILPAGVDH